MPEAAGAGGGHRPFGGFYAGRRVLVTGHTGFVGGWATRWLVRLGAEVAGYSRGLSGDPRVAERPGDIVDAGRLHDAMAELAPDVVVHLAGSTLVSAAFREPARAFAVNVGGTAAVLDAALAQPSVRAVVVTGTPATPVLGSDLEAGPYAASKLATEAVVAAFAHPRTQEAAGPGPSRGAALQVGVARPGVMIGGDWGEGRLLADVARSVRDDRPVVLRAPHATRPWQHVLDGISGVLTLAARLAGGGAPRRRYDFGRPEPAGAEPVAEVVGTFLAAYGAPSWPVTMAGDGAADRLDLGCGAASADLGWRPVWSLAEAVAATARWYRASAAGGGPALAEIVDATIASYEEAGARVRADGPP
jgi:CDP-glucose 4,6-dehydratase